MKKLISFDLQGDFAFFRKPETNDSLNMTYNMIHKPSVLGILGAIIGLKGYEEKDEWPEYYKTFKDLKIGVAPLGHDCGTFTKTPIGYSNTIGYANKGKTFLTEELTIVAPKYRVYLLLDDADQAQGKLLENLRANRAEYIPYLGKNEYTACWTDVQEYAYEQREVGDDEQVKIISLFQKETKSHDSPKPEIVQAPFTFFDVQSNVSEEQFFYFERLPIGFDETLKQYELSEMMLTNYQITHAKNLEGLFYLKEEKAYVQLF